MLCRASLPVARGQASVKQQTGRPRPGGASDPPPRRLNTTFTTRRCDRRGGEAPMSGVADVGLGNRLRSRAVYIHSRGSRLFLGCTPTRNGREVTVEEVEALTSAGFEIVEINMREGAPLCAALATVPVGETPPDSDPWRPQAALISSEPRAQRKITGRSGLTVSIESVHKRERGRTQAGLSESAARSPRQRERLQRCHCHDS